MEESKKKRIEDELRKLIALQNQSEEDKKPAVSIPVGTRLIRRRKGTPDKHIS